MLRCWLFSVCLVAGVVHAAEPFDLVIQSGRVIDPETELDAVRNVGVRDDRIAEITAEPIEGVRTIDARGLVVSPGFIDLHVHGQTNDAHRFQAYDGVTTALELESGRYSIREFLRDKEGTTLVNYGASASQVAARINAMDQYRAKAARYRELLDEHGAESAVARRFQMREFSGANYESLQVEQIDEMTDLIRQELADGALGIGVPVGYVPGASSEEMYRLFEFAAAHQAVIFTHVRDPGIVGVQEMIANAAATGAPLHVVHLNSMALGDIVMALDMIEGASSRGVDVTTELYPYTAASTSLESALFDAGWQQRLANIDYGDLQWEATGERLTAASFERYRQEGGVVIIHMMKEAWIEAGLSRANTMIASDGMPYAPGAHPRTAGTFARVLGRYVREQGILSLSDAIRKMTLMPAQRLQTVTPAAQRKGRIQVGADADITVFDPETVADRATFEGGLKTSRGIPYVIVNGTVLIDDGELVEGVYPGRPVLGRYRR